MRATSIIVLLLLAAGIAYMAVFQWEWVSSMWEQGRQNLAGYTPAETPEDAMDKFAKAIEERDYKAAAKYCTGEYQDNLLKAADEAYAIASRIDQLKQLMINKGLMTDRSKLILLMLDPFPASFERSTEKKIEEDKDDEDIRVGWYVVPDPPKLVELSSFSDRDHLMFRNPLMPTTQGYVPYLGSLRSPLAKVEIVDKGQGDEKNWKLKIPLDAEAEKEIKHMIEHHKKYTNALDTLIDRIRRPGQYPAGVDFEGDLIEILAKQNEN